MKSEDWERNHILYIANEIPEHSEKPEENEKELRKKIEPWLTAVFQSEHFSILLGSGLTSGICDDANCDAQAMQNLEFTEYKNEIKEFSEKEAERLGRGEANFEDDLRTAIELYKGLAVLQDHKAEILLSEINEKLSALIKGIIENEKGVLDAESCTDALALLQRFLISFSSRTATRDRLHIFTTNYDRFIEYALDSAGIHILDRFIGKLNPIMRMHKIELDYHYNPPGIRGEPRYVEGVVRYTKLHGSVDWRMAKEGIIKEAMPFGDDRSEFENPFDTKVIYPNSSKGIETAYFPYSELIRDFSTATCRPNSVLVTYGYGFGDSHINSIILDMMTIPSTHLVIISFDTANGRLKKFVDQCNISQITLLIGRHYGNLRILTEKYLPKSAIDKISDRRRKIEEKRRIDDTDSPPPITDDSDE